MTPTRAALRPRYYPAGLTAWLVGVPAAAIVLQLVSGFALGSEQGPMFRLETTLFALLGFACTLTAFVTEGDVRQRATWVLAAAVSFLMVAVDNDTAARGVDYDSVDVIGLILTAAVLALLTRFQRPPAGVGKLLAIGFALQCVGILVDLSDGGYFDVSAAQAVAMGGLDEIIDLVLAVVYCASFFAMLVHVRIAAVSGDTPSATIHRLARTEARRRSDLRSIAHSLLWGVVVVPVTALSFTSRNGGLIARRTGRPLVRQFGDQIRLAFLYGIPPSHYYVFELFDDVSRSKARDYLLRSETKGFAYAVLRERPISPLTDKLAFFRRCEAHQLSVVPVVLALDRKGHQLRPEFGPPRLPPADLFIKPNPGKGGRGAERWDYVGEDTYRRFGSRETVSAKGVIARLQQPPFAAGCIVQPKVMPHKALADLTAGALPTVRVVTCRDRNQEVEATNAVFRMARSRESMVDNFHAGGIAASVDIASGRLGAATDLGRNQQLGWVDVHPETRAKIAGRALPFWKETIELATRAHREAFADRVVAGWDIAILDTGPALVEGNSSPDLDIVQRTHRQPVGEERLGVLLAAALEGLDAPTMTDRLR